MLSGAVLRKTGTGWEFASEAALEDFVWANLEQLFGLTCLKRQYYINGQVCDILGLSENKQLVVLELKNAEDRYIVQQLTRYYDALCEEKPFSEEIDYKQPIGLVAIAPSFHRDNFTDRKYSHLVVEFLRCEILLETENLYLQLKDVDSGKVSQIEIPHQETDSTEDIPPPPRALLNRLTKCNAAEQQEILIIREIILRFDKRMQEIIEPGSIKYGIGKNKICAEFRFDSERSTTVVFLWLPLISSKPSIGRLRIWTDWKNVSHVAHVTKGLGRAKTSAEWEKVLSSVDAPKRYPKKYGYGSLGYVIAMKINDYMDRIGSKNRANSLKTLVDMALEKWLKRI